MRNLDQRGLAFASHFASTHLHNALRIYTQEFQPSEFLSQPYTIAGVNVVIAYTEEEAEALFTSLIGMFYGMLTGNSQPLQPPTEMTDEWRKIFNHPSVHQMLKYSFVGSKQTVKAKVQAFFEVNRKLSLLNLLSFRFLLMMNLLLYHIVPHRSNYGLYIASSD